MKTRLPEMQFSSIVFDLDGTLSDPSVGVIRCFNHSLRSHGFPELAGAIIQREIGPQLDKTFKKLTPSSRDVSIEDLVSTYRERYADIGYAENSVYDGIPEALAHLDENRVPMGVCTSKREDFAEKILSMFGLEHFFRFVSGGDVGIAKASQLSALLSSNCIDRQAAMIGDRHIDIESAHQNGLSAIGVQWGFGDIQELKDASPVHILSAPSELCGISLCKQ